LVKASEPPLILMAPAPLTKPPTKSVPPVTVKVPASEVAPLYPRLPFVVSAAPAATVMPPLPVIAPFNVVAAELVISSRVVPGVPIVTVAPVIEMDFEPAIVPVALVSMANVLDKLVALVPAAIDPPVPLNSNVSNVLAPLNVVVPALLMIIPLAPVPVPSVIALEKMVAPVFNIVNVTPLLMELEVPPNVILFCVLATPIAALPVTEIELLMVLPVLPPVEVSVPPDNVIKPVPSEPEYPPAIRVPPLKPIVLVKVLLALVKSKEPPLILIAPEPLTIPPSESVPPVMDNVLLELRVVAPE
jgi:hypothetical protein